MKTTKFFCVFLTVLLLGLIVLLPTAATSALPGGADSDSGILPDAGTDGDSVTGPMIGEGLSTGTDSDTSPMGDPAAGTVPGAGDPTNPPATDGGAGTGDDADAKTSSVIGIIVAIIVVIAIVLLIIAILPKRRDGEKKR